MPKKILVVGASGEIGQSIFDEFSKSGYSTHGTFLTNEIPGLIKLDPKNVGDVEKVMESLKPLDLIVIATGIKDVNRIEQNWESGAESHVISTLSVCEIAERRGVPLIYISSVYSSLESPNFYGRLKAVAEAEVLRSGGVIVRPEMVYGVSRYPTKNSFLARVKRGGNYEG